MYRRETGNEMCMYSAVCSKLQHVLINESGAMTNDPVSQKHRL